MFQAAIEARCDRSARRSHVLMNATLMTPTGAISVRIRDISLSGAQIWGESEVPGDCDAVLKRGSFFAAARVVRGEGRNAALQFYRQLSDEEFASAFRRNSAAPAMPRSLS